MNINFYLKSEKKLSINLGLLRKSPKSKEGQATIQEWHDFLNETLMPFVDWVNSI